MDKSKHKIKKFFLRSPSLAKSVCYLGSDSSSAGRKRRQVCSSSSRMAAAIMARSEAENLSSSLAGGRASRSWQDLRRELAGSRQGAEADLGRELRRCYGRRELGWF